MHVVACVAEQAFVAFTTFHIGYLDLWPSKIHKNSDSFRTVEFDQQRDCDYDITR